MVQPQLSVSLRDSSDADQDFVCRVYASSRAEELALTGWPADRVDLFLREQFRLQDLHYRRFYPGARFQIVLVDGVPAGRLCVHSDGSSIRVMDIALLPRFRGQGIGRRLFQDLMDEADAGGRALNLHVEFNNPVRAWYLRLGFKESPADGVYLFMERPAVSGVKA